MNGWAVVTVVAVLAFRWTARYDLALVTHANYVTNDLPSVHDRLNIRNNRNISALDDKEFHVVTQWYFDRNLTRLLELTECLADNLRNPYITNIHFIQPVHEVSDWSTSLFENMTTILPSFPMDLFLQKVSFVLTNTPSERLLFNDSFQYANTYLSNKRVAITNLDISFDSSLKFIFSHTATYDLTHFKTYFLSRYERTAATHHQCSKKFIGSHDVIIFKPPLPNPFIQRIALPMGSWGIEARIMYELEKVGVKARNPCYTIKTWHWHESGVKNAEMPVVNTNGRSRIAFPEKLNKDE